MTRIGQGLRRVLAMAGALALVATLSACGGGSAIRRPSPRHAQKVRPCPLMGVLYDAARVVELRGPEEAFSNVGYTAEMRGVSGFCRYVGTDPIVMNLDIDMAFGRGPKAESDQHTYRYWVAVSRRDVTP